MIGTPTNSSGLQADYISSILLAVTMRLLKNLPTSGLRDYTTLRSA
ncbi:MAG: hypothetical protein IPL01_18345 [Acidobacteria bacterium]|nr:hypothetical protein [Acidobacteriota bacterium]